MSDTPRTDAAKKIVLGGVGGDWEVVHIAFSRQLERELTAAQAEIARLKAGGCARDQRTTQFCAEALKLQEENAKLQERVRRLELLVDAIKSDEWGTVIGDVNGMNWFDARKEAKDAQ